MMIMMMTKYHLDTPNLLSLILQGGKETKVIKIKEQNPEK